MATQSLVDTLAGELLTLERRLNEIRQRELPVRHEPSTSVEVSTQTERALQRIVPPSTPRRLTSVPSLRITRPRRHGGMLLSMLSARARSQQSLPALLVGEELSEDELAGIEEYRLECLACIRRGYIRCQHGAWFCMNCNQFTTRDLWCDCADGV
ncbi:uncharacterized protein [Watersipora subatra]|uniref:uncharacterized protein n=1 Tax=Watersipora subatra TaxID=2589382 RepID=UPI00355B2BEF